MGDPIATDDDNKDYTAGDDEDPKPSAQGLSFFRVWKHGAASSNHSNAGAATLVLRMIPAASAAILRMPMVRPRTSRTGET